MGSAWGLRRLPTLRLIRIVAGTNKLSAKLGSRAKSPNKILDGARTYETDSIQVRQFRPGVAEPWRVGGHRQLSRPRGQEN